MKAPRPLQRLQRPTQRNAPPMTKGTFAAWVLIGRGRQIERPVQVGLFEPYLRASDITRISTAIWPHAGMRELTCSGWTPVTAAGSAARRDEASARGSRRHAPRIFDDALLNLLLSCRGRGESNINRSPRIPPGADQPPVLVLARAAAAPSGGQGFDACVFTISKVRG